MARDYKHRRRTAEPKKAPRWRWFLSGFALGGLGCALVLVGYDVSGLLSDWVRQAVVSARATPQAQPAHEREPPPASKPKFEFYTMLPEMEVAVPESEIELRSTDDEATSGAEPEPSQSYILQVGSFRQLAEADRQKATLALLGLEADIQTVSINGQQTWHRVRLGPYASLDALKEARGRLYENQIDAIVLKLKI